MLNALGKKRPPQLKRPDIQQKQLQAISEAARQKMQERGLENQTLPQNEQVALSKELSEEMEQQEQHQGIEALLANLGNNQKFDQKLDEKVNEVGGAAGIGGNKAYKPKQKPQEVKAEWKPDSERGKIHKSHEKIGDVRLTAKKKSPDSKEQPSSAQNVAQIGGARPGTKGAPKTDAPRPVGQAEATRGAKPDTKVGNRLFPQQSRPLQDKVELSGESQRALNPLQQAGNAQAIKEVEQKAQQTPEKTRGGQQEGDLGTVEVKTKADNWNQSAAVRPAGEVQDGDVLRFYQRLDGISPDLLEAIRAMQGNHQDIARDQGAQMGLRPEEQLRIQAPQSILK